jgi:hypothetical protein
MTVCDTESILVYLCSQSSQILRIGDAVHTEKGALLSSINLLKAIIS